MNFLRKPKIFTLQCELRSRIVSSVLSRIEKVYHTPGDLSLWSFPAEAESHCTSLGFLNTILGNVQATVIGIAMLQPRPAGRTI